MAEKFTGYYEGKKITFNREWGGHRFTDSECITLCELKEIEFDYITKSGQVSHVKGSLAVQTYKGHKYFGFKPNYDSNIKNINFPNSWCRHIFTDDEKNSLIKGEMVHLNDCISNRTGKPFSCDIKYDTNNKKLVPIFNNNHNNVNKEVKNVIDKTYDNVDKVNDAKKDLNEITTNIWNDFDDLEEFFDDLDENRVVTYNNNAVMTDICVLEEIEDNEKIKYAKLSYSNGTVVIMYYEDYDYDKIINMSLEEVIKNFAVEIE